MSGSTLEVSIIPPLTSSTTHLAVMAPLNDYAQSDLSAAFASQQPVW